MTLRRSFLLLATRRRLAAVVLVLLPLLAVAARRADGESSPTSPSDVANISGTWTGTSGWLRDDVHVAGHVTMSIHQHDRVVTGTIAYTSERSQGWGGTIHGVVAGAAPDTQFAGTIELRVPPAAGSGTCVGTANVSGRSVSNSLRWDTSQLIIAPDPRDQPAPPCRGVLRSVALIMGRE